MPLVSKLSPQELVVNFYCRETSRQERVNVWKVQCAPSVNIQVGQTIWFQSNIFVMGLNIKNHVEAVRKAQGAGGFRYGGQVLSIVEWQKNWVRFSVGSQDREEFHLLVPVDWTALGLLLHSLHTLQKGRLPDSIPSRPGATMPM